MCAGARCALHGQRGAGRVCVGQGWSTNNQPQGQITLLLRRNLILCVCVQKVKRHVQRPYYTQYVLVSMLTVLLINCQMTSR